MDDMVKGLQSHLDTFESLRTWSLRADVNIRRFDLHERVEILSIGPNEVKYTNGKCLGILCGWEKKERAGG